MPTEQRYSAFAIALHWTMALLVVALFALGWNMVELPQGPQRSTWFALHKSLGLTLLALLGVRVWWRLRHAPPPFPDHLPRVQAGIARLVHLMFYVLLVAQPVSGYLSSSFSGYRTAWFGLPLPHWGWRDAPLNEFFTEIHVLCSIALGVLVAAHVLGFLSHLIQGDDAMVRRMRPW